MYWSLGETGGTRYDLSGNDWDLAPSSNDGSDVGDKLQVISWTDKSGVLGAFYAGDGPEAVFQMKHIRKPTYNPNALGPGRPGVVFGRISGCTMASLIGWRILPRARYSKTCSLDRS